MNDLDIPTSERAYKRHATVRAQAAILGFELIKSDPEICGHAPYYLYRHDGALPFEGLDELHDFMLTKCDKLLTSKGHG